MRRPLEALGVGEPQVRAERLPHRLDEAVRTLRREPVLPPQAEHLDPAFLAIDAWLDSADEPVAEEDREDVVAPAALLRLEEPLPHELEVEQAGEQGGIPEKRVERRDERDGR